MDNNLSCLAATASGSGEQAHRSAVCLVHGRVSPSSGRRVAAKRWSGGVLSAMPTAFWVGM